MEENSTQQQNVEQPQATVTPVNVAPTQGLQSDEILFGTLSYFTIAVLATMVAKPNSEFCKFHAKQGVVLVAFDLLLLVLISISLAIVPFLAYLFFFVGMMGMFVLHVLGIVHALQGKMYKIPFIHGIAQKVDISNFFGGKKPEAPESTPGTSEATQTEIQPEVQSMEQASPEVPTTPETPTVTPESVQPVEQAPKAPEATQTEIQPEVQSMEQTLPQQPMQPVSPQQHGQDMVDKAVEGLNDQKNI